MKAFHNVLFSFLALSIIVGLPLALADNTASGGHIVNAYHWWVITNAWARQPDSSQWQVFCFFDNRVRRENPDPILFFGYFVTDFHSCCSYYYWSVGLFKILKKKREREIRMGQGKRLWDSLVFLKHSSDCSRPLVFTVLRKLILTVFCHGSLERVLFHHSGMEVRSLWKALCWTGCCLSLVPATD